MISHLEDLLAVRDPELELEELRRVAVRLYKALPPVAGPELEAAASSMRILLEASGHLRAGPSPFDEETPAEALRG